jgi:hypothetical protein
VIIFCLAERVLQQRIREARFEFESHFDVISGDVVDWEGLNRMCDVHDVLLHWEGKLSTHVVECDTCRPSNLVNISSAARERLLEGKQ